MKKIIMFLIITAAVIALFAVSANAALIYSEDFSELPESGKLKDVPNWIPYHDESNDYTYFEDGAVRMDKAPSENLWTLTLNTEDKDHFLMFDIKLPEGFNERGPYIYYTGKSGLRIGTVYLSAPEPNEWYTYLFQTKTENGTSKAYVYRKKAGDDTKFELISTYKFEEKTSSPCFIFGVNRVGLTIWVDNFVVQSGTYVSDATFAADGTEFEALSEIPEDASEITASIDLYNADMVSENMYTEAKNVRLILLGVNEKGMMVDCNIKVEEMNAFENFFEVTLPVNGSVGKMKKLELYIWDSMAEMLPVVDPIAIY